MTRLVLRGGIGLYKRATLAVLASLVGLAALVGGAPAAWASSAPGALELSARPTPGHPKTVELTAAFAGPASSEPASIAGATVSFSVQVGEFAGAPALAIGAARTDAAGVATLVYRPTWRGRQVFIATATTATGKVAGTAKASLVVTAATHAFAGTVQAARPDGIIGRWVAGVLLGIVATVWIVLAAVVVRVNLAVGAVGGRGRRAGLSA